MLALGIQAGPADPSQRKTIKLADGSEKVVQLVGDEYGHYWKALDNSGCFRELPGKPDSYKEVSETEMKRAAAARRMAVDDRRKGKSTRSQLGLPCTLQNLRGTKKMLVILVSFQDELFSPQNFSTYNDVFNAINYIHGDFKGSVKDYFRAQSNNLFELDFDVVGPVTVSRNGAYYGAQTETQNDSHVAEMVEEALALVDDQVDFSRYDWDKDGTVEQVVVIYAGLAQELGGTSDDIWSHKSQVNMYRDHVFLSQYACSSEYRMVNNSKRLNSIGSFCHEISHCFGLSDTYDQSTGNYGTDRWDLMGVGVHNDNGYTPAGFMAFNKMYCLWQDPVILRDNQQVTNMRPMSEGGAFYLIPNDAWNDEFYLLENRQKTGWDNSLPGHGMLITHVDYDEELFRYNIVNRTGTISGFVNDHERLGLFLADNDKTVDASSYAVWVNCYQGDLYPYQNNNSLTNTSTPRASLYHKNLDETFLMSKPVTEIKENGDGSMRFKFTNNMASYSQCHLLVMDGEVRLTSDTSAKLVATIKNDGYVDFNNKIAAYVYTVENGSYAIQSPRSIQTFSLPAGTTRTCEFPLTNLMDNTNYYVFLFYYKDTSSTNWTQMSDAYPFNMASRYSFTLTMDRDDMVITKNGNSATIKATFHNKSFSTYNRNVGLYTYFKEDGAYKIQQPRAFAMGNIQPYGEQQLTFTLDNLEYNKLYHAFFFYYPDASTTSWQQLGDATLIIVDPDAGTLKGDLDGDGEVSITDVAQLVNVILQGLPQNADARTYDINDDGEITVADVNELVAMILSAGGH